MFTRKNIKTVNFKKVVSFFIGLSLLLTNYLLNSKVSALPPPTNNLVNADHKHRMLLMQVKRRVKAKCDESSIKYLNKHRKLLIKAEEEKESDENGIKT
ncbi:MAG: hypothetical protein LBT82_02015 [Oscillospiraceae bacterium]|jgi:hypothetical protein|nr:hypothetical protein [Oscillospiraceae bacterium]